MGWIKTAADRIEQKAPIIEKSFQVTGIVEKPDCTRSDALYKEIQDVMIDIFGPDHMGYVEPTQDPFADSDSSCVESTDDPFAESNDNSDTEYSNLEYSNIETDDDECANNSN